MMNSKIVTCTVIHCVALFFIVAKQINNVVFFLYSKKFYTFSVFFTTSSLHTFSVFFKNSISVLNSYGHLWNINFSLSFLNIRKMKEKNICVSCFLIFRFKQEKHNQRKITTKQISDLLKPFADLQIYKDLICLSTTLHRPLHRERCYRREKRWWSDGVVEAVEWQRRWGCLVARRGSRSSRKA